MIDHSDVIVKRENSKSTRKLYRMSCDKCSKDRGYKRKVHHGLGMCRSCVSKQTHTGKMVSIETKKKMGSSQWLKNGGKHPMKGNSHSKATKAKLSIAAIKQLKAYSTAGFRYKEVSMRSSWEVKYAKWLDNQGIKWLYEPEFVLSDGRVFIPDFKLDNGTIVEIKGYFRNDARIKWDLFCSDYPELKKSLLQKEQLKKLGVL